LAASAFVLTKASNVLCGPSPVHGGAIDTVGAPKLTVQSQAVLLQAGIMSQSVDATNHCHIVANNTGNTPCLKVTAVNPASLATKLTVGGTSPVALATLSGGTNGTVGGTLQTTLTATAGQTKLTAT
jgi:hypothetical protein